MVVGMTVTIIGGRHRRHPAAGRSCCFPVDLVAERIALIGVNWILSLLNVVFRDIQNILTPVLMMMLIISPIAYTPEIVPDSLRPLILLNPFAYFVVAYQQVIVLGIYPGRCTRSPSCCWRSFRSSPAAGSSPGQSA